MRTGCPLAVIALALTSWPLLARAQATDVPVPAPAQSDAANDEPVPAPAQPDAAIDEPVPAPERPDAATKANDKKAKKPKEPISLDATGRLLVRGGLVRPSARGGIPSPGWSSQLDIDSARVGLRYRNRDHDLQIEIESELASDNGARLRDAYIRVEPRSYLRVKVGQFKRPISAVTLTSRWDLPTIDRGLLDDFELPNELTSEQDELPLGGRAMGVQAELRGRDLPLDPRFTVGLFRSRVHEQLEEALGANRQPLSLSQGFPEDIYSRLELELEPGLDLGVSLGWFGMLDTGGTRDTFRHGFVGGVDLVVEAAPIRLWLEGFMGESPMHFGTQLLAQGQFVAVRSIFAARIDAQPTSSTYVEPYVSVQYLDASSDVDEDTALELGGGVTLGIAELLRVQLEGRHRIMDTRLFGAGTELIIQLGAVL